MSKKAVEVSEARQSNRVKEKPAGRAGVKKRSRSKTVGSADEARCCLKQPRGSKRGEWPAEMAPLLNISHGAVGSQNSPLE